MANSFFTHTHTQRGGAYDVIVKVLEFHVCYSVHFRTNSLEESMNPLIPPTLELNEKN